MQPTFSNPRFRQVSEAAAYRQAMVPYGVWLSTYLGLETLNQQRADRAKAQHPPGYLGYIVFEGSAVTVDEAYFDDGEFDPDEYGFHLHVYISHYTGPIRGIRDYHRVNLKQGTRYKLLVTDPDLIEELKALGLAQSFKKAVNT